MILSGTVPREMAGESKQRYATALPAGMAWSCWPMLVCPFPSRGCPSAGYYAEDGSLTTNETTARLTPHI